MKIEFKDIKDTAEKAMQESLKKVPIKGESGFSMLSGFLNPVIQPEMSDQLKIGGNVIPCFGLVGLTSGRVYLYSAKFLCPEIKI